MHQFLYSQLPHDFINISIIFVWNDIITVSLHEHILHISSTSSEEGIISFVIVCGSIIINNSINAMFLLL